MFNPHLRATYLPELEHSTRDRPSRIYRHDFCIYVNQDINKIDKPDQTRAVRTAEPIRGYYTLN